MRFSHGEKVMVRERLADNEIRLHNAFFLCDFQDVDGVRYGIVRSGLGLLITSYERVLKIPPSLKIPGMRGYPTT